MLIKYKVKTLSYLMEIKTRPKTRLNKKTIARNPFDIKELKKWVEHLFSRPFSL